MKLSLNWLKDFVKFDKTPEKLAEVLTFSGTEVEKIEKAGPDLKDVVVGEIKTIVKHSNADKLKVCKVRVKKGKVLNIVCGAPNIKVGQKVPVALVGAKMPDGFVLEKTKIRGIESEGMLLAEDEMGIGDYHEGIYILEDKAKIGQSVRSILGLKDSVLDLALTPNRADCFSYLGVAREVAAVTNKKLNFYPEKIRIKDRKEEIKEILDVKILDKKLCSKYTARVIENVEVKDSPEWLKNRLRAAGVRPINNIVDVTNYVMLELGQPLHAFDFDLLSCGKKKSIIVRQAKKGEKLTTLDDKERELEKSMLVIADSKKAIALAGVMGGKETEINEKTNRVILESAIFQQTNIRKTAQSLALRSESSNRFEKGLDNRMTEVASDRAAALIAKLSGGKVVSGRFSVFSEPKNLEPTVTLDLQLLNKYLNIKIPGIKVKNILKSLGFKILSLKDNVLKVKIPSWRQDVKIPEDLIEEVGRIYDYNKLKPTYLKGTLKPQELPKDLFWERKIKEILVSAGLTEVYNYSFYSEKMAENFDLDKDKHYRVTNPLNPEQELLRQTLIPRLLENVSINVDNFETVKIFEIGNVYLENSKDLPKEKKELVAIVKMREGGFRFLKGVAILLLEKLSFNYLSFKMISGAGLDIFISNRCIGRLFAIKKRHSDAYKLKLKRPLICLHFDFDKLVSLIKVGEDRAKFKKFSQFPSVKRDIAFFIPKNIQYIDIEKEIKGISGLIFDIELFDIYQKEGKTSVAIRITFQANRTLESKEVDEVMNKIYSILEGKFKIKVRK